MADTHALAFYRISTTYPQFEASVLAESAAEIAVAFRRTDVGEVIFSPGGFETLKLVWTFKPTMVHPDHIAVLASELDAVLEALPLIDAVSRGEIETARRLCEETAVAGEWLVTLAS